MRCLVTPALVLSQLMAAGFAVGYGWEDTSRQGIKNRDFNDKLAIRGSSEEEYGEEVSIITNPSIRLPVQE